jgi:CHAT domain-containing protein/tetratricopeptide (TPR) repeat protein
MYERLFGTEDEDYARMLLGAASVHADKPDFVNAELNYRRALKIIIDALDTEDHLYVALIYTSLGHLLDEKSDFEGAERHLRRALEIIEELIADESDDELIAEGPDVELVIQLALRKKDLASNLQDQEYHQAAGALYGEALALVDTLDPEHDPAAIAAVLHDNADLQHDLQNFESADSLFRQVLLIYENHYGAPSLEAGIVRLSLARNLRQQRQYGAADSLYADALSTFRHRLGATHPNLLRCLYSYSSSLLAQAKFSDAEPMLREAAEVYDSARLRTDLGLNRAQFQNSPYPPLACTLLELDKQSEGWRMLEKDLGRVLSEMVLASGLRAQEPAADLLDSLSNHIASLEAQLNVLEDSNAGDREVEDARAALIAAETAWTELRQKLRAADPPVAEGGAYALTKIQKALPNDAALMGWLDVELRRGTYSAWQYVIKNKGPVKWARVDQSAKGLKGLRALCDRFRRNIANPATSATGFRVDSADLWRMSIGPLADELDGVDDLIIVPSGFMLGIPVEVLSDATGSAMGDRFNISYSPSATIFAWLAEKPERNHADITGLFVGDAAFNKDHLSSIDAGECGSKPVDEVTLRSALGGNKKALSELPRLPGTRGEVESASGPMDHRTVLLGLDASEQRLVRLVDDGQLPTYGYIHFATHALVDNKHPDRSALVLTQVDLPDALESARAGERIYDGLVTAREILRNWKIDADLVTLSACETGLGKVIGGEGYVGFSHAFFQAGARSLLVSLWKVDDCASSLLMQRFYENLTGSYTERRGGSPGETMNKSNALKEAKRWLRNWTDDEGNKTYAHPAFWSAFILIGDRR